MRSHCLAVLLAVGVAGAGWHAPTVAHTAVSDRAPAHGPASAALRWQVALRWEVIGLDTDPVTHKPRTHAILRLTNRGAALPAGCSLWFTAMADPATADPRYAVRRVAGSLYAIALPDRLPSGGVISIPILHFGEFVRDDKGPTGAYIVLPQAPGRGIPVVSFQTSGITPATPGAKPAMFTDPAAVWAANRAWQSVSLEAIPPVLPTPKAWHVIEASAFTARLGRPNGLAGAAGETTLARHIAQLAGGGHGGLPFHIALGAIAGETSGEAYRLTISREGVSVTGASAAGLFYGLQSLDHILFAGRQRDGRLRLRETTITDAPRFGWRGLLIDPVRNYIKPAQILRLMRLMALFKLNRLHLHLSDDEGWRIAIPALPELTEVGANRGHALDAQDSLPPALGSGPKISGGYFTSADYLRLLLAARRLHIEVVPEIDMPGHARAAIRAMASRAAHRPQEAGAYRLTDPDDHSVYHSAQGYSDNAMDAGLPATDRFLAAVVAELARLHRAAGTPLRHVHIGGDELPAGVWEGSAAAQARTAQLGGGGRQALWDDFFDRKLAILRAEGIQPIGWEELGMLAPAPPAPGQPQSRNQSQPAVNPHFAAGSVMVQIWNDFPGSENLPSRLANAGYPVILSPARSLYFDMAQAPDPSEPGHNWAGVTTLEDVYDYDPLHIPPGAEPFTKEGLANVVGLEGTLFSETVRAPWRIDHMLMPRMQALAERAWGPEQAGMAQAAYAAFLRQLGESVLPFADARLPGLRYRLPPPGAVRHGERIEANYAWPGVTLRYTMDGSLPRPVSRILPKEFVPPPRSRITIAAFAPDGRSSPSVILEPGP